MKNLTLRIEEKTLESARCIAAGKATSVNKLVRGFLDDLVQNEDRSKYARRELLKISRNSKAQMGKRNWNRDKLYER